MSRIALSRLLQLASQTLPIGGYSHSQGLESAIERGVVRDEASLGRWLADSLEFSIGSYELPCLLRMIDAWEARDALLAEQLNQEYLATREAAELRSATVQMGHSLCALLRVLPDLPAWLSQALAGIHEASLPCAWGAAASAWRIERADAALGYVWAWCENQVLVAMKTLPLGQSAGHRVLFEAGPRVARLAGERAAAAWPASNFAPGLAILSAQHETQYSRLFRS